MSNAVKPVFVSCVALGDSNPFSSFKEALEDFIVRMKALVKSGAGIMIIEEGCWIEMRSGDLRAPLGFYNVRDLGYKLGLLGSGSSINKEAPEPDVNVLTMIFSSSVPGNIIRGLPSV